MKRALENSNVSELSVVSMAVGKKRKKRCLHSVLEYRKISVKCQMVFYFISLKPINGVFRRRDAPLHDSSTHFAR